MSALFPESAPPRIGILSTGYVVAEPPLVAADTDGRVVYGLELAKKPARHGFEVDVRARRLGAQTGGAIGNERMRVLRVPCGGRNIIDKEHLVRPLGERTENSLRLIRRQGSKYQFFNSRYRDAGHATRRLAEDPDVPRVYMPDLLGLWEKQLMEKDFPEDNRFFPMSAASRNAIRRRLGFAGKVVLAIGRLARTKGCDLLIDAFTVVATRIPDAVLHLADGGTLLNPAEQRILADLKAQSAVLGLGERVKSGGFVSDADLADYYRAADVFVLSSRYEPFGMTAIEAMACGTPTVIATHGGLFRAVTFGRHALYADPFDNRGPRHLHRESAACSLGPATPNNSPASSRNSPPRWPSPITNGTSSGMTATDPPFLP